MSVKSKKTFNVLKIKNPNFLLGFFIWLWRWGSPTTLVAFRRLGRRPPLAVLLARKLVGQGCGLQSPTQAKQFACSSYEKSPSFDGLFSLEVGIEPTTHRLHLSDIFIPGWTISCSNIIGAEALPPT